MLDRKDDNETWTLTVYYEHSGVAGWKGRKVQLIEVNYNLLIPEEETEWMRGGLANKIFKFCRSIHIHKTIF